MRLRIEGMSCDHCVQSVSRALRAVTGVSSARVELPAGAATGEAVVEGSALAAQLVDAVRRAGYEARVVD